MFYQEKYLKYKNKYLNLKKQVGGNPIGPEDILFSDFDVCILKPEIKKGILVFTNYKQPASLPSLCKAGLKTGAQLKSECIEFGRSMIHPYIFFRAPYFLNPIDYTSIETEIISSFGEGQSDLKSRTWIRIDPEKTFVYSSEIRVNYSPPFYYNSSEYLSSLEKEVYKSRKRMTEYLQIIYENTKIRNEPDKKRIYNLFSSKVHIYPKSYNLDYPLDSHDVSRQSEVLVRIPHLTSNYFVKCT